MEIKSGIAQGFILGPDLWNTFYDSSLRHDMPEESRLVGYADDIAALVAGRSVEQVQSRLGIMMRRVSGWMTAHGFSLALEKKRSSHLDQKENPKPASHIDRRVDYRVKTSGQFSTRFNSRLEDELLRTNQSSSGQALSRLIANGGSPISTRRRLPIVATQSILLYGAEVWVDALDRELHL